MAGKKKSKTSKKRAWKKQSKTVNPQKGRKKAIAGKRASSSLRNAIKNETYRQFATAVSMMVDPFDYAQFTQPRLFTGRVFPGLQKMNAEICSTSSAAGAYPGCNQYLCVRPTLVPDSAASLAMTAHFAATSITIFTQQSTLLANPIVGRTTTNAEMADQNIKACAMRLRYNGDYALCKGRVWAGMIPSLVSMVTIAPQDLMLYPGVKEYSMDELLKGEIVVWGSKASTHANDFISPVVNPDDYNIPFLLIFAAPLWAGYTTASAGVSSNPNNLIVESALSYDYRPTVLLSGGVIEATTLPGQFAAPVKDEIYNRVNNSLGQLPSNSYCARNVDRIQGGALGQEIGGKNTGIGFTDIVGSFAAGAAGAAAPAAQNAGQRAVTAIVDYFAGGAPAQTALNQFYGGGIPL